MKHCEIGPLVRGFSLLINHKPVVSSRIWTSNCWKHLNLVHFAEVGEGGRWFSECPGWATSSRQGKYLHLFTSKVSETPPQKKALRLQPTPLYLQDKPLHQPFLLTHDHKTLKTFTPFPAYFLFSKVPCKNFPFRRVSALMSQPQDTWLRFLFPSLTSQPFLFLPTCWNPAPFPLMGRYWSDKLVKGYRWLTVH